MSRQTFLVLCGIAFPIFMTACLFGALSLVAFFLERSLSANLVRNVMGIIFIFLSAVALWWVRDNWKGK